MLMGTQDPNEPNWGLRAVNYLERYGLQSSPRADDLLRSYLSPSQHWLWDEMRFFYTHCVTLDGETVFYAIGDPYFIVTMDKYGERPINARGISPQTAGLVSDRLPVEDYLLAQKLVVEADPSHVSQIACIEPIVNMGADYGWLRLPSELIRGYKLDHYRREVGSNPQLLLNKAKQHFRIRR